MKLILEKKAPGKKRITADIEHLRKLFIMPDTPDKFMEFGQEILYYIHDYFTERGGIHSEIPLADLARIFSDIEVPRSPKLLKDIFVEIKDKIIAHSVKVGSPYYIGHMTSAIPYFTILIEMIIAALNQNQVKIETAKASTFLERELTAWIHRLIFQKSAAYYKSMIQDHTVALGNVASDGTIANLTALLVARNRAFPPDGRFPGIRHAGIHEAFRYYRCKRAVIIVSRRGHYSFDKVARSIGIGDYNVIKVSVDENNKIDLHELKKICAAIQKENDEHEEKIRIFAMVGIAGTTETGNIDNLRELRAIADRNNAFFHVDAAWGGPVLFVEKFRHLFKGIEKADSVTFDCHKLLYSPLSMGMVLFRDENALEYLKHSSQYIIRPDSVDQGRFTLEGSRPFTCLKPWTTLKVFGSDGFRLLFENAFEITAALKNLIDRHPDFEGLNNPELFIYNYRFVPCKIQEKLNRYFNEIPEAANARVARIQKKIFDINELLNELNIELHRAIRREDTSFVSRTMLESTRYRPQKIVVLRSVTINPLTNVTTLQEIINEQDKLGSEIYRTEFKQKLAKV